MSAITQCLPPARHCELLVERLLSVPLEQRVSPCWMVVGNSECRDKPLLCDWEGLPPNSSCLMFQREILFCHTPKHALVSHLITFCITLTKTHNYHQSKKCNILKGTTRLMSGLCIRKSKCLSLFSSSEWWVSQDNFPDSNGLQQQRVMW